MNGIGGHTTPNKGATDSWITPRAIIESLGSFDLDPCQCEPQPWLCAANAFTISDDGLSMPWNGRVWLNPPYSTAERWLDRLASHGRGTALIFARTETEMFVRHVWKRASGLMFIHGRLFFHTPGGARAKGNSGGPSVLVAYGSDDAEKLRLSGISGSFCKSWE